MKITKDFLEQLRPTEITAKTDSAGAELCQANFEYDIDMVLNTGNRPNKLITTFNLATQLQRVCRDILHIGKASYEGDKYNQLCFQIPIPFALDIIPHQDVEPGEYFIIRETATESMELLAYRHNIAEG